MIILIPSSLLLFLLLWRMFANFAKWNDWDRLRAMRRQCALPFKTVYPLIVSGDSVKETPPPNDLWMKRVWNRAITLAYLHHRISKQ